MTDAPVSRPWRRYLRFSVRGLIVLVLVIGAALRWIVHEAHAQRDAVAALRMAGGLVQYDWEWRDGNQISGGKPWAPRWLVELIGVDYFSHVTTVQFPPPTGSDSMLVEVERLTQLQLLSVNPLARLKRLNKLTALWLDDTQVTDAGLAHLKGLTNLTVLRLDDTQVTDAGLAHLKGLTNLTVLWLDDTQVTDAGLVHLKGLTNLTDLSLRRTQVTSAGLAHLKGLTNLTVLWLDDTQVTDAGLVHLKGLTNFTDLWLDDTQVTDAGINELKRALPGLTIYH